MILSHAKTQSGVQAPHARCSRGDPAAAALQNKKAKIESDAGGPIHLCLLIFLRPRLAVGPITQANSLRYTTSAVRDRCDCRHDYRDLCRDPGHRRNRRPHRRHSHHHRRDYRRNRHPADRFAGELR